MVEDEQLARIFETANVVVEDDESEAFQGFTNQQKMFHKIRACHDFAMSRGDGYDLEIRIRPDNQYVRRVEADWEAVRHYSASARAIHVDGGYSISAQGWLNLSDQFAVGVPEVMAPYVRTLELASEAMARNAHDCPPTMHEHSSLAFVMATHGVLASRFPFGEFLMRDPPQLAPLALRSLLIADQEGRVLDDLDQRLLEGAEADIAEFGPLGDGNVA